MSAAIEHEVTPRPATELRAGMVARHPETRVRAQIVAVSRVYDANLRLITVLVDFGGGVLLDLAPDRTLPTYRVPRESELDAKVATVADLLELGDIDATPAVVMLREATGLCPRLSAELLKRELRRRRQQTVEDVEVFLADTCRLMRDVQREGHRDDDGRWTP